MSNKVTIKGYVKNVTFRNDETGFFIVKVATSKGEYAVKGTAPVINPGEYLIAEGVWEQTDWGRQIKAETVQLQQPTMVEAIEKYLHSSVPGIGKVFAKKLVDAFGEAVFDIIENKPDQLKTLKGIGKAKIQSLVESFNAQKSIREVMVFLHNLGLGASRANRIYDIYGDNAIAKISENPYCLAKDVYGIGFHMADSAAIKLGLDLKSEHRIKAGILHVLTEAQGQGSCGLPVDAALIAANALLEVGHKLVENAMLEELQNGNLYKGVTDGVECLFSPAIYFAEKNMARLLLEHVSQPLAYPISDIEAKITAAEAKSGITLDAKQKEAVRLGLQSQIMIITGGPGCGKTTITKIITDILADDGLNIMVCAPTGKAADRASESTGLPARTIHRTLGFKANGAFEHHEDNKLETDVIVIDEFSMVDVLMGYALLKAISLKTRIIILGDIDQLPSVGPGLVLSDLIASGRIPFVRLTHVFRQGAESAIKMNAARIREGKMPVMEYTRGDDFVAMPFVPKDNDDESKEKVRQDMLATLLRLNKDAIKLGYHPVRDVQVLTPMNKGILGVESLNLKLQQMLNPAPAEKVEIMKTSWRTNDKVMQIRNNYKKEVFNGDIGFITDIKFSEKIITVSYDDKNVDYFFNEMDEVRLAYAFTVHKSQGSEAPYVIMPIDTSHFLLLKRNIVYTGITRAKKQCVVLTNPKAMAMAVNNSQNDSRYSMLKEWLTVAK